MSGGIAQARQIRPRKAETKMTLVNVSREMNICYFLMLQTYIQVFNDPGCQRI